MVISIGTTEHETSQSSAKNARISVPSQQRSVTISAFNRDKLLGLHGTGSWGHSFCKQENNYKILQILFILQ